MLQCPTLINGDSARAFKKKMRAVRLARHEGPTTGGTSMSSQTIRSFRLQSRFLRRLAALLAVLLLPASVAAVGHAAPQKEGQDAARKAFDEGERLRQQATPDSLRGAVEKYQEAVKLWHAGRDGKDETAALASLGLTFQLLQQHERAVEELKRQ